MHALFEPEFGSASSRPREVVHETRRRIKGEKLSLSSCGQQGKKASFPLTAATTATLQSREAGSSTPTRRVYGGWIGAWYAI
jgi:hypothetical protein